MARSEKQPRETKEAKAPKATKGSKKGSGLVLAGVPRVNLLPPSEVERRRIATLTKRWLGGLVATAVVVSSLAVAAHWLRAVAVLQLAAEQDRTVSLNVELASFSEVSKAIAERSELTTLQGEAMGNDLEWRAFFKELSGAVPNGTELRSFDLVVGANPVTDAEPDAGIGLIGRLTLWSEDAADLNRFVDKLRSMDITLSADAGSLVSANEDGFTFSVEVVIDQSHYSGDFVTTGGAR